VLKIANRMECRVRRPARRTTPLALGALAGGALLVLLVGLVTGQWPGAMAPAEPRLPTWLVNGLAVVPVVVSRFAITTSARGRWGTLQVASSGELSLSWLDHAEVVERTSVELARWRAPGGRPEGLVALIPFGARRLAIGGAEHDGLGYWLDGFPIVEGVDAWLPAADFERLLAALPGRPPQPLRRPHLQVA